VVYCVPLIVSPRPEGGHTVTSPVLPELITEGDIYEAAHKNVRDALAAVIELYAALQRPLPQAIITPKAGEGIWFESLMEGT
jgi:antitoxin HicB